MKILLIDDENELVFYVKKILVNAGNEVKSFGSLHEIMNEDFRWDFDVVILDLLLPEIPGKELINKMRKEKNQTPVLILSAVGEPLSKTDLLNLGADDYLTKPFDSQELLARVNALHRRAPNHSYVDQQAFGDYIFCRKENRIQKGEKEIFLTERESEVLDILLKSKGKTIRTTDLLQKIWHVNEGFHSNVVQATVHRLREKLLDGFGEDFITNIHGVGYRISQ